MKKARGGGGGGGCMGASVIDSLVMPPRKLPIRHKMMPGLLRGEGVAGQPQVIEVNVLRDVEPVVETPSAPGFQIHA